MLRNILFAGLGGALGTMARFGIHRWMTGMFPHHFPWGTFSINMIGCLLIGIFWGLSENNVLSSESTKIFLMVGICGGFTTFSAFTLEGVGLLKDNRAGLFLLYAGASVILGLLATYAGMRFVR